VWGVKRLAAEQKVDRNDLTAVDGRGSNSRECFILDLSASFHPGGRSCVSFAAITASLRRTPCIRTVAICGCWIWWAEETSGGIGAADGIAPQESNRSLTDENEAWTEGNDGRLSAQDEKKTDARGWWAVGPS
jgi:hypothetical protein